jgi:hypothetical protein
MMKREEDFRVRAVFSLVWTSSKVLDSKVMKLTNLHTILSANRKGGDRIRT